MAGVMGDPAVTMTMFYLMAAIIIGAAVWFFTWAIVKQKVLKWYVWVMGIVGVIGLIATAQHSIATLLEGAPFALGPGLLLFGLPSLLLLGVGAQLYRRVQTA